MSIAVLQIKARNEWYGSGRLQQEYATPEYYWAVKYRRVYCPGAALTLPGSRGER